MVDTMPSHGDVDVPRRDQYDPRLQVLSILGNTDIISGRFAEPPYVSFRKPRADMLHNEDRVVVRAVETGEDGFYRRGSPGGCSHDENPLRRRAAYGGALD